MCLHTSLLNVCNRNYLSKIVFQCVNSKLKCISVCVDHYLFTEIIKSTWKQDYFVIFVIYTWVCHQALSIKVPQAQKGLETLFWMNFYLTFCLIMNLTIIFSRITFHCSLRNWNVSRRNPGSWSCDDRPHLGHRPRRSLRHLPGRHWCHREVAQTKIRTSSRIFTHSNRYWMSKQKMVDWIQLVQLERLWVLCVCVCCERERER